MGGRRGIPTEKKENTKNSWYSLTFVVMLYIEFQVPGSSGSLVLKQTKGVTENSL